MMKTISVIISTHNPNRIRLLRTLEGLAAQSYDKNLWRLIIVDNASDIQIEPKDLKEFDFEIQLVRENRLGLTYGGCRGIACVDTPYAIFVDDDNVLAPSYLAQTLSIFTHFTTLGLGGGRSFPEFEVAPPSWIEEFYGNLALRDLGSEVLLAAGLDCYPTAAPIGAGMIAKSEILKSWANQASRGEISGRKGKSLTSGEDCDLVMYALRQGLQVGYFPDLNLVHLIPEGRLRRDYLARLNYGIAKSWVEILDANGIRPWPKASWGLPLRKARAYIRNRAWASDPNYIRWQGACGAIEGRSTISLDASPRLETRPNLPASL